MWSSFTVHGCKTHKVMSMYQFVDHFLVDIVKGESHSLKQIPGLTLPSSGGILLVKV